MVRIGFSVIAVLLVAAAALLTWKGNHLWVWAIVGPLVLLGLRDMLQTKHAILRNYPIIGHGRYLLESIRPEIMQYFVETDTEGRPINRIHRRLVYQRAKDVNDTTAFGTQRDVYETGYEWMDHSMFPAHMDHDHHPRVRIGGPECTQPYNASILNISAMSFGSLSDRAVMAMNGGAKAGGFAQNTGEGGIAPYHLNPGGDLIWQIGTGYFGCRTKDGNFDRNLFTEKMAIPQVRMAELKLSQGAKPGHGGILPAIKNTEEIAKIRGVEPHTAVHSPPYHKAFDDADGLMNLMAEMRQLAGGKPVGFKLCIGQREEFVELCRAMIRTGHKPDFITIDGGEGGTGAAPVEFSDSLGMPLRDGLAFAFNTLRGFNLKRDIKLIAAGKIVSGWHMARAIALGADVCYSARAMMLAVGCIQALQCNKNTCPTGVATQNKQLVKGLNVEDKTQRIANYHRETVRSFVELLAASGFTAPEKIRREHINRRVSELEHMTYEQLYPLVEKGALLQEG
ncbi:MAG: FMN-binding glutamate synthase family protein [Flavobacteriales bacterium]